MDTEFSGHEDSLEQRGHDYDSVEVRYKKLRSSCTKVIAFQIGLCCFRWDEDAQRYYARPFSFYVF